MQNVFDIYTIIFLALAVFIFLRLRSVLGQRTGRERPPYDPYSSAREPVRPGTEKVVALPNRAPEAAAKPTDKPADKPTEAAAPAAAAEAMPASERWTGIAAAGSPIAAGLDALLGADPAFDAKHFLTGARAAYEMIVNAYAEGDRRSLKSLLSREVYDGFETAINEREKRGETVESRFVAIDKAEISAAELRARTAQITVRFVSQLVSATRDKNGNVIDGNPEKVTDITDVWTFARDVSARDPNWKLVATEAGQ
jgi:predicted lipid-binding transport protein (Tim44 family)